jgi:hypothetical protein
MSAWAPGLTATLVRPGASERNGVGAQRRLKPAPFLPSFVEEITAFEPERRLSYRAVSGIPFRNYAADVQLRAVGQGTEIAYSVGADNRIPAVASALAHGLLFALKRAIHRA